MCVFFGISTVCDAFAQVSIGFVVGLNYANPYLNPYREFQVCDTERDRKNFLHKTIVVFVALQTSSDNQRHARGSKSIHRLDNCSQ